MKNGIMTAIIQGMIIMAVVLALGIALPSPAIAQGGSGGDIKYTGAHGRNVRVSIENGKASIVKGTIYEARGNSIFMDGESFSIGGADIKDQAGIRVKPKELYPGLKVHLLIRNGSVVKMSIKNFFRSRIITDQKEMERNLKQTREGQRR